MCYSLPMRVDPGLGQLVLALRLKRGLSSQGALAELAGLNKETVNRVEQGLSASINTISKIAIALGTTAAELYAATVAHPPVVRAPVSETEQRERELVTAWFECGPGGRAAIEAYAQATRDAELREARQAARTEKGADPLHTKKVAR